MTDCEFCYMNPPWEATEDGEITFLPVPSALPDDTLCADCRQQNDDWARAERKHREEKHQAPWEHDCLYCSLTAYEEDRERNWQAHLAGCQACQDDDEKGHVQEAHRDFC